MQNGIGKHGGAPAPVLPDLTLSGVQAAYAAGSTPSQLMRQLYGAWAGAAGAFITLAPLEDLLRRARELEALPTEARGSLHGVPFGVKDNIDVDGFPTTAACEAFRHAPAASAPVVDLLLAAGGIMVGKTNMDQFAAGLVGTRTPYGVARNAFDARFVPGGSSSGSGALVGAGLLSFCLGTDTAGSGRVPAMFNGCVGVKPTVGRLTTRGVVPACRTLDCVTVFAQSVADGASATRLMEPAGGLADPTWVPPGSSAALRFAPGAPFRFGVPGREFTSFDGPGGDAAAAGYTALYEQAAQRLAALGGTPVPIDFSPFAETAAMLYGTSFIAERYAGIREFLEAGPSCASSASGGGSPEVAAGASPPPPALPLGQAPNGRSHTDATVNGKGAIGGGGVARSMSTDSEDSCATAAAPAAAPSPGAPMLSRQQVLADRRMERVTRAVVSGACGRSAADLYGNLYHLTELKTRARVELAKIDVLLVPTAAHHYTIAEVVAQEQAEGEVTWGHNANLGRFTNFVNLLDMAGIAIPSGLLHCAAGGSDAAGAARQEYLAATGNPAPVLPFGVTLLGPAWSDEYLWGLAGAYAEKTGLGNGPAGHGVAAA